MDINISTVVFSMIASFIHTLFLLYSRSNSRLGLIYRLFFGSFPIGIIYGATAMGLGNIMKFKIDKYYQSNLQITDNNCQRWWLYINPLNIFLNKASKFVPIFLTFIACLIGISNGFDCADKIYYWFYNGQYPGIYSFQKTKIIFGGSMSAIYGFMICYKMLTIPTSNNAEQDKNLDYQEKIG